MAIRLKMFLLSFAAAVLLFVGLLYLLQDKFIYHPRAYAAGVEADFHRPLVRLPYTTANGPQVAFYVPPITGDKGAPPHVWLLFSGNASLALDYDSWLRNFDQSPDGFLLIDYPGYGFNTGTPSRRATEANAEAALEELATHFGMTSEALQPCLGVFGVSLGAAVALEFAVHHPAISRIVLAAPFTSLTAMARRAVGWPLCALLNNPYNNASTMAQLGQRKPHPAVAIFHGDADRLIPVSMSRTMATDNPFVNYYEVKNADHNSVIYDAGPQIAAIMAAYDLLP